MAIYKPTYCYPYGGNVDFCVDPDTKAIYLQCKLNTSNKKVTGYKLILADGEGNTIWEPKYISPVASISQIDYGSQQSSDHGEGFNGDTLIIPFIQNLNSFTESDVYVFFSASCLYTSIDKSVDYFINENVHNIDVANTSDEVKNWNNNFSNSYQIPIGARILTYNSSATPKYQIYKVIDNTIIQNTNELFAETNYNIYVKYGADYHESVLNVASSTEESAKKIYNWLQYLDSYSSNGGTIAARFKSIRVVTGSQYSWKIILYQGDATTTVQLSVPFTKYYLDDVDKGASDWWPGTYSYLLHCIYSEEYNINQYDILITQGQILGSTGERLQIYPADVVLQKYFVQLGHATLDGNGIVTNWEPISSRANIQIYDSTYGHIYPQEGVFAENILEENSEINACAVYKHSNNPDDNLESDMVVAATVNKMNTTQLEDIIFHIFNGELMTIDGVNLQGGDLVLLKDLTGYEYLNGVYSVSASLNGWKRSGSYSEWSQFLGKIILVKNGAKNSWHNFQSQAQVTGVIGSITGSGVNAQHPIAGRAIFKTNAAFASNPTHFAIYQYQNGSWSSPTPENMSIQELVAEYRGQYVFMFASEGTPGSAALYRYFIPATATVFSDFQQSVLTSDDILAVKELTPNFGFISLSVSGSTWSWSVNSLTAKQKGSELFFIPEQPITLYPHYENLVTEPTLDEITAVYLGQQIEDSPYTLQYELQTIRKDVAVDSTTETASLTSLPQILIDGKDLEVGEKFLGIYENLTDANYDYTARVQYAVIKTLASIGETTIRAYKLEYNNDIYTIDTSQYLDISVVGEWVSTLEWDNVNSSWGFASYTCTYHYSTYHSTPYLSRRDDGSITARTKISISFAPSREVVVYDGLNLVNPIEGTSPYYFGEYTVSSKNGTTTWDLSFLSLTGPEGLSDDQSIPNKSYKVEKGEILGNVDIMTLGTYALPIVQYGNTNKVGILNINSVNKTYIKPSNNIKPNQYLVFTEVDESERRILDPVDYINYGVSFEFIGTINNDYKLIATDTTYWSWKNFTESLVRYTKPSPSVGDGIYTLPSLEDQYAVGTITSINPEPPAYSSVTNSVEKTPYKYKIMSYFKESDYNPITYSGNAKIGFAFISSGDYQYDQMLSLITAENQSFILDNTIYTVTIDQQIILSFNYNPDILLRGYYEQGAGKRWEYYRMAIFDIDGVLLQDTGNIYDGDFSQYFWGLRPNINTANINYALLIVEDEFGKIYTAGVKLNIYPTSSTEASCHLNNIRYNYNLQSVDIDLGVESYGYTLYRKELNSVKGIEIVDRIASGASNARPWTVRDYNITNNRKYAYYINQDNSNNKLTLLELLGTSDISTNGKCWSITELYPTDLPTGMENSLTVRKKYVVDENNVWLFKYNGEFGSQTQNIAKSEQSTLGKYPRIGQGMRNNQTGSVSCLLGSEIVPGQLEENTSIVKGYQERLRSARYNDASTPTRSLISSNSAIDMLNAWRAFVQSKNPKLLKDVKGQSWIVQITSNQNTPMSHVQGQPDSISFSWVQIGDTKNIIITGNIDRSLTSDY